MATIANNELNSSKTWEITRLLQAKDAANLIKDHDSTTSVAVGNWSSVSYNGDDAEICFNKFSSKPGETQYRSTDSEGLSPIAALKVGCKDVKDVYAYSTLAPEKLKSAVPGKQAVVSLEELFRASRVTSYDATTGAYTCYGETGHLPFAGWVAVRIPKHNAVTISVIRKFIEDLRDCVVAVGDLSDHDLATLFMSLLQGDIDL